MTSPSEPGRQTPPAARDGLRRYLATCREIAGLCTQNGWIDDATLEVDVLEQGQNSVLAAVTFEEIVVEGAGCVAGRVPCYGRVRAWLGDDGEVRSLQVL